MSSDVSILLSAIQRGETHAADDLLPLVYKQLREMARQKLTRESAGQTLQATALVHEAYLRLVDVPVAQKWHSRKYFFVAAAEAMRRILIENARRKEALKRGGDFERVDLSLSDLPEAGPAVDVLEIDEALTRLAVQDAQAAELVKLRYFTGLPLAEAAETKQRSQEPKTFRFRHLSIPTLPHPPQLRSSELTFTTLRSHFDEEHNSDLCRPRVFLGQFGLCDVQRGRYGDVAQELASGTGAAAKASAHFRRSAF